MKKLIWIILLFFLVCSCNKQEQIICSAPPSIITQVNSIFRTYSEAEAYAKQAIDLVDGTLSTKSGKFRTIENGKCYYGIASKSMTDSAKDTLFYVFNYSDNAGFAVIAGNRSVSPIIAVTEKGSYDPYSTTGVDGFDNYMDNVKVTLNRFPTDSTYLYSYYVDNVIGTERSPLVSVRWGQRGVYGQYCPNGISGCVPTAMVQILTALEKPDTLDITVNMGSDFSIGDRIVLDWPSIRSHIVSHSDSLSCNVVHKQIGALLREIGDMVDAVYSSNGTAVIDGENSVNAYRQLGLQCSDYRIANINIIKNSLLRCRPVQMFGSGWDYYISHSWLADGYKDIEIWRTKYARLYDGGEFVEQWTRKISESHALHINWGWSGICNGYFTFETYNTENAEEYDTDINTVSYNFYEDVNMITDIYSELPPFTPIFP